MSSFDWDRFLEQWSKEALNAGLCPADSPQGSAKSGCLGFPGAMEEQIVQAELRLGATLPPSYRAFLKASNGWYLPDSLIERLWSIEEIGWFSARHQDWIEQWTKAVAKYLPDSWSIPDKEYLVYGDAQDSTLTFRDEYLKTTLEISPNYPDTSAIYLLNPQIITAEGEWEAWFFANWLQGAYRHSSFEDLMLAVHKDFVHQSIAGP